jgi:DNA repair ATPase RecN
MNPRAKLSKIRAQWEGERVEKLKAEAIEQARRDAEIQQAAKSAQIAQQIQPYFETGDEPMETNEYANIISRHADAARAEIEAEEAKSADQKKIEALDTELGRLSATVREYQKQPTRYRSELTAATARQAAVLQELENLGAIPKAYQPAGDGNITFVSNGIRSNRR